MGELTFDPDDIVQADSVLLADGRRVLLDEFDPADTVAAIRQCWTLRSAYAEALVAADPTWARRERDPLDLGGSPLLAALERRAAEQRTAKASRASDSLPAGDLFQTRTWTSGNGASRALTLMSPTHRRSVVGWLERNAERLAGRIDPDRTRIEADDPLSWIRATPLHARLTELLEATSPRDAARDQARQIARRLEFERTGRWPEEPPMQPST